MEGVINLGNSLIERGACDGNEDAVKVRLLLDMSCRLTGEQEEEPHCGL